MMRRRFSFITIYILSVVLLSSFAAAAQDILPLRKISGQIRDENKLPLEGISVKVKGNKKATFTDKDGRFHIEAGITDTLLLTAVGYSALEVPCHASSLSLIMLTHHESLQEVVIGYGREKKEKLTGSVSSITSEELEKSPALSFDNAIIGKAAGVFVSSSSGVPGSATAITIRGLSTLNPDGSQPLIVVDGIPIYGSGKDLNNRVFNPSTVAAMGFGGTNVSDRLDPKNEFESNPLSALNPADIESIEILKDAYATAIYGSRGSAGVILITTKKGEKGRARFNLQYLTGSVNPIAKYKVLNGPQYNEIYTEYYKQLGTNNIFNSPYNTSWLDSVTRTGISQQLNLTMSGGTDKARIFISGSYTDQPSYIIKNGYQRYTGRINTTYTVSPSITFGADMSLSYSINNAMNAASIWRQAALKAPNLPIRDENGNFMYTKGSNPFGNNDVNPVADALLNTNQLEVNEGLGNLFLEFKPITSLVLRSEFGVQFSNSETFTRRVKRPSGLGNDGLQTNTGNKKFVINNTANFIKTFQKHYVNAMIGQSYEQSVESKAGIGGYNFFSDDIKSIAAAGNKYVLSGIRQKWAMVSYFSRFNYEFNRKYLAGITYRVDGSSRFSRNNRYLGFPSFSAGWRISEEDFMKNVSWVSQLKLRGSVGFSGNNSATSYYGSLGQYVINSNNLSYAGVQILQMSQPENPNLKWEKTGSYDIGLDATLWGNRIEVTLDYYQRRIRDMILSSAIPLYQGWTIQPQNIGDMVNKGAELFVRASLIRKKDFEWSANMNISTNSNKILKLNFEGEEVGLANDAYKYMKAGEPAGQFYLYDWVMVDPQTGNPLWNDGKGALSFVPPASLFAVVDNVNDFRKPYGTSLPDIFGGMGHTLTYKNWELDVFASFAAGSRMINGSLATLLTYSTEDANNLSTRILDRWLVPGHQTDIPRLVNASITKPQNSASGVTDYTTSRTNKRFLENSSYLRLRTITLSYDMDVNRLKQLTSGIVSSLRIFVRGTNLFTLTNYTGLDPEVSNFGSSAIQSGYDELTMPQNKLIQFGINVAL